MSRRQELMALCASAQARFSFSVSRLAVNISYSFMNSGQSETKRKRSSTQCSRLWWPVKDSVIAVTLLLPPLPCNISTLARGTRKSLLRSRCADFLAAAGHWPYFFLLWTVAQVADVVRSPSKGKEIKERQPPLFCDHPHHA